MIDYTPNLVATLNTILPTHYEMILTSNTAIPCISYMEMNNSATDIGDTVGYSRITYQIKVWGNDIKTVTKYALEVDSVLKQLGFKRISSGDMHDNQSTIIQRILTYEALALEKY